MPKMKSTFTAIAKIFRVTALGLENWYWVLLAVCIISPVSPHVRVPYTLSYSDCAYIGTRGMIRPASSDCSFIAVINTRDEEIIRW